MAKSIARTVPLASLNSTALTNSYQAINPGGLPEACWLVNICNGGTTDILISLDGTTDNEQVLSRNTWGINAQQNSQPNSYLALFQRGQIFYAKGTAGSSGSITVSGYYVQP